MMNIPFQITKDDFKHKVKRKLDGKKYKNSGYIDLITANYTYDAVNEVQNLNTNIPNEMLEEIDFIFKQIGFTNFVTVEEIPQYFRKLLEVKKRILLFAYNGTGKTRISSMFKDLGKQPIEGSDEQRTDTLYYNAFTEDLFYWDNDLENDTQRVLRLNRNSRFFNGIRDLEMESKIRPFLSQYTDFDFSINYDEWYIVFSREIRTKDATETTKTTKTIDHIKISRGEEVLFIWCFFLAIIQLVIDNEPSYSWVQYIYIDDPVSSLDDNNAIAIATHLGQLLKQNSSIRTVISTHHALFFNVMFHELKNAEKYFLSTNTTKDIYFLKDTSSTPFFHHVALLKELKDVAETGTLYTYHFNTLRNILEKTASFHGFKDFSSCIKRDENDVDGIIHTRMINLLNHGGYSLFDPKEMIGENKEHFINILEGFLQSYKFNEDIFNEE